MRSRTHPGFCSTRTEACRAKGRPMHTPFYHRRIRHSTIDILRLGRRGDRIRFGVTRSRTDAAKRQSVRAGLDENFLGACVCAPAMCDIAGTAAAHAVRCRKLLRASFIAAPLPPAGVAVGTCVSSHAPRTDPYMRLARIRLPPRQRVLQKQVDEFYATPRLTVPPSIRLSANELIE